MSVANAYARALYETIQEAKAGSETFAKVESEMNQFVELLDQAKDARLVLFGPVATAKEKMALVQDIAKRAAYSDIFSRFLGLMARKERLSLIGEVREAFSAVKLVSEGGVLGELVSAETMSESDLDSLAKAFSQKLGKKVAFRVSQDPEQLAGMKVTVNGVTYDGTLRSQLERLRDRFSAGFAS